MLPQMSMQISAAENAASVFVDGVELHAGGKEYFKNGDTADSGATGTYEDHSAYYDTAGELWLNNLEAHTIKANGNLTIYVCNNQATNTNIVTATQNETAIEVTGYLTIRYGGYGGGTGSLKRGNTGWLRHDGLGWRGSESPGEKWCYGHVIGRSAENRWDQDEA